VHPPTRDLLNPARREPRYSKRHGALVHMALAKLPVPAPDVSRISDE
jgi:hypothetical protein